MQLRRDEKVTDEKAESNYYEGKEIGGEPGVKRKKGKGKWGRPGRRFWEEAKHN